MNEIEEDPRPIEVRRTGAHLGWNVLAALGAFLFGMYINSAIMPLENSINTNTSDIAQIESAILSMRTEYKRHEVLSRATHTGLREGILILKLERRGH